MYNAEFGIPNPSYDVKTVCDRTIIRLYLWYFGQCFISLCLYFIIIIAIDV